MAGSDKLSYLRSPRAVRERATAMYHLGLSGELKNFKIASHKLLELSQFVAQLIRARFPNLEVPYHSRWRHFSVGGIDRVSELKNQTQKLSDLDWARLQFDLVVVSVLLDAGAGSNWSYQDRGRTYARSEGLAVASFEMFRSGLFSSDELNPFRVDSRRLLAITEEELAWGMQCSAANQVLGLAGRLELLHRLGASVQAKTEYFGTSGRVGGLFDYLLAQSQGKQIAASKVLNTLLNALADIWPGRIEFAGQNLGDVWKHSALKTNDETNGLVPLHKLSQWLTYSLLEPLESSGLKVIGLEELTGLAEYRNGGLFLDFGVLAPLHVGVLSEAHEVSSEIVVEWRALTVALLDALHPLVAHELGLTTQSFTLPKMLEGGTWAAGRELAFSKRSDGGPPIRVISDGTVF